MVFLLIWKDSLYIKEINLLLFTVNTVPSLFAFWSCKKFDLYKFLNFYVVIQSCYIVKNRYDFYKQEGEGQSFRTAHKGILLKVVAWITELLPDSKNKNMPLKPVPTCEWHQSLRWKVICVPWTKVSANFSKGPDSKHFGHSGPYNLHCRDSTQLLHCKSSH